jgi:hemolysin activation/secretion protein
MRRVCLKIVAIFCISLGASCPTVAAITRLAALDNAPSVFDAGRVGQQIQQSVPEVRNVVPAPSLPAEATQAVAPESKIRFTLTRVIVSGNTVFPAADLQKLFQSSLKKNISLVDLKTLAHNVTIKYREAGYILSHAILPPQTIKNGVVRIAIVQGFVSDVIVKGNVGQRSQSLFAAYGKYIKQSYPLNIHVLQRYLLLANDLPGYTVKAVLTPSKHVPAGADLTLLIDRKKASAFLTYDNFGTRYIGPHELSIGGSVYSVFAAGDVTTLQFSTTSRPHELQYAQIVHAQPMGAKGLRFQIGTNYTETRPSFVLDPVNIIGRNNLVFADLSYPLLRDREGNIILHAGANYQNISATILSQPFYTDRLRSIVVGGAVDNIDKWHGINTAGLDVAHDFEILGAKQHVNQSRPKGHAQATRINVQASRLQAVSPRLSLLAALHGQYALTALLAAEQFGFGGSDYGRGYDPSEIVGDRGLGAKLEFRVDTAPAWRLLQSIQYYAFYDAGMIWNIDKVNLPGRQSATSTGIGARFSFMPQLSGNLFLAKPLSKKVKTLSLLGDNTDQARILFQIVANI